MCGKSKSVGKLAIRAVSRPPRKRGLFRLYAFLRCREESVHLVIAIILCDPVCAPPAVRKTFQTTGKNKNKNTSDRGTTRGSTAPRPDMPPPPPPPSKRQLGTPLQIHGMIPHPKRPASDHEPEVYELLPEVVSTSVLAPRTHLRT